MSRVVGIEIVDDRVNHNGLFVDRQCGVGRNRDPVI